jgi:gamma-glutamyltranspeptidase/glutathione hydrolase
MGVLNRGVAMARASSRQASARTGVIATAHSLASEAGRDVLAEGGNAMDAAIAAAAVLGVVQPMMSGLGGDTFILYLCGATGRVVSINGSGPAPASLSLAALAESGRAELPDRGLLSASVPGAVDAMCVAHRRFGSGHMTLARLLAPAIRWAAEGAPVAPVVARFFASNAKLLAASVTASAVYCKGGTVPAAGEILRQPALAETLQQIADGGAEAFYRGPFARRLVEQSRASGIPFSPEDLASYGCEIVEPISIRFRDKTIYTNPPVSQGIVLLEALGILEALAPSADRTEADRCHAMIEALKLAFADRNRFVGDPAFVPDAVPRLLDPAHLRQRAAMIDPSRALVSPKGGSVLFGEGDTSCLSVADSGGNVVAYITSLSTPFGAAEVVEGTGVLMNNRVGRGFSIDPKAPNCLAPGKRTMSTLHVYIVCDEHGPVLAGGTSGGDGQPQWNLQILDSVLGAGRDIQAAVDMPRWELSPGTDPANLGEPFELKVDPRLSPTLIAELRNRGHAISDKPLGMLGAAQAVMLDPEGAMSGAADPRADGCVLKLG